MYWQKRWNKIKKEKTEIKCIPHIVYVYFSTSFNITWNHTKLKICVVTLSWVTCTCWFVYFTEVVLVVAVILSDCKSNVCFSVGLGPSFRFELLSVDPWVGWLGVAKALAGRGWLFKAILCTAVLTYKPEHMAHTGGVTTLIFQPCLSLVSYQGTCVCVWWVLSQHFFLFPLDICLGV